MGLNMALSPISSDEAAAKRFEANGLFTPSTPIAIAEMFAGRQRQASKIVDAIGERGRHIILYGERGVGKSSMAQIAPFFLPSSPRKIRYVRVQAFPGDTFSVVAKRIFSQIHFEADYGEGQKAYSVAEFYPGDVTIDHFLSEMQFFKESEIPIITIDEFNEIDDEDTSILVANIIKALSDMGANVTIVIVGVADNIIDLFERHQSIERCTEQIMMPRMSVDERRDILDRRLSALGMSMPHADKQRIINLSKGLPSYVHALGKHAVFSALDRYSLSVDAADVDAAIGEVVQAAQQTLKSAYELATRSNSVRALFRHVITACALAKVDDAGYFMPAAVREPLANILSRPVDIANFQDTLRDFAEKKGSILQRMGESRAYRFRFREPAMQPYVLMRGIKDGLVDHAAMQALSSSEQSDLFASD
jgi:Cdc6-like AAA superfamily ATPase